MTFRPEHDVARAATPRGDFYGEAAFAAQQERVFPRTWHTASDFAPVPRGHAAPFSLLPGALGEHGEPLLWTRGDDGRLACLSNVCTHRGKVLLAERGPKQTIRCDYHGRCFGLDGTFRSAPGFDGALDFPRKEDDLPAVPHGEWAMLRFCSLAPATPFAQWTAPLHELMAHFVEGPLPDAPAATRDYEFDANWALYVDNYLEGFHVPYVHPALARGLALQEYVYETWDQGTLQLGIAKPGEQALALPRGHRFAHLRVAGAYVWLFPCTMLNFYPWGLSLNVVEPLGPARTRVRYAAFVVDEAQRGRGAGGDLDTVEHEDEAAVLATHRGVQSRLYRGGRYAPKHEAGVHRFHTLLANALS